MLNVFKDVKKITVFGVAVVGSGLVSGIISHKKKKNTFDEDGYNQYGYDNKGYDREGYNKKGYDKDGYNKAGFDTKGYDREGYNCRGYNKKGYNKDGYNLSGYDKDGYNIEGYNRTNTYNIQYDRYNFNTEGYDKDGYDRDGYNTEGYDKDGYDRDGYDTKGYDKDGYDRKGYDINGYDICGYDCHGIDQDGFNRAGYNSETMRELLESQKEKLKRSFNEFSKGTADDLLNRTRKQIECILVYILEIEDCFWDDNEPRLRDLIDACKENEIFEKKLVEKLYEAIKYCNKGSHFNTEKVDNGCVYFTLKTTNELIDFWEKSYME